MQDKSNRKVMKSKKMYCNECRPQSNDSKWEEEFEKWWSERFDEGDTYPKGEFYDLISSAVEQAREEGYEECVESLINLPRKFWEDEDHAVGGYISKKELYELLKPTKAKR